MKSTIHPGSFKNAFEGLTHFIRTESNGRIQFIFSVFIILLSFFLNITKIEWVVVLICIGVVLCAEILNSALESLCDYIQPLYNPHIKIIKDLAAGAVLVICVLSSIIGVIIFVPKILKLL